MRPELGAVDGHRPPRAHRAARARARDELVVPRLRDERDRGPGAARRARRAEARAPPRAVRDARHGPPARPALREEREHRRPRDGRVPPPRRPARSTTPSSAWRRTSPRATRWSTARATSARASSPRRPCGTRRPASSRIATEMLRDIDEDTVDDAPTYDDRRTEPVVLPARVPNLLINGSSGIAVGMATNIPPHNLGEVIDAVVATIDDPAIEVEGLMRHVKAPDFPTGGIIVGRAGVVDAYTHRPGPGGRARPRPQRAAQARPQRDRVHRAAVPGQQGGAHPQDGRPGQRQGHPRDRRPARRERARRRARGHRAAPRRGAGGGAEQALQAHRGAEHVRRQRDRPGQRRAAHARPQGHDPALPGAPEGGGHPALALPAARAEARAHILEGLLKALGAPRRGHRAHPRRRPTPRRPATG